MEAQLKRKILLWIAWGLGAVLFVVLFNYLAFTGQFHRYRDDLYKFAVKFPKRWGYSVHPMPGGALALYSPQPKGHEGFRETINISVQDLPTQIATVNDLTEVVLKQMKAVFNNLKVEQSVATTMAGRKAWMVVFSAEKPDPVKILTIWTVRDAEKAYILTYMARTEYYKEHLALVDYMRQSFKFF